MDSTQWILAILGSGVVFFYFRRFLLKRSLPHYTAPELAERMRHDRSVVVLDVRSTRERQHSHIEGSLHIPLHQLGTRSDELSKYREREIVCYCQSGNRSLTGAARLKKLGFKSANLVGGIGEWNFHNSL